MIEVLGFLEHVLAKDAVVEAGGGDRAHVVEAARLHGGGELERMPRALDIRDLLRFGGGVDVVDRGEMEEVPDFALQLFHVGVGDTKVLAAEFADDGDHLLFVGAPDGALGRELLLRALAHEHVDRVTALQQVGHQELADEAGRAGDKVRHDLPPCELLGRSVRVRVG